MRKVVLFDTLRARATHTQNTHTIRTPQPQRCHHPHHPSSMARTKQRVRSDHLNRQQRAASADRAACRRASILRAARMLSSQEAAQLRVKEPGARSQETGEASPTDEEEEVRRTAEELTRHTLAAVHLLTPCIEMHRVHAGMCAQACCSHASRAPAASGCAYGSRRRSGAAEEAHEQVKDCWADEARGLFREREGRRSRPPDCSRH